MTEELIDKIKKENPEKYLCGIYEKGGMHGYQKIQNVQKILFLQKDIQEFGHIKKIDKKVKSYR